METKIICTSVDNFHNQLILGKIYNVKFVEIPISAGFKATYSYYSIDIIIGTVNLGLNDMLKNFMFLSDYRENKINKILYG